MEGEDSRLGQFRRLRKEICGSEDYLVVGIDVAKDKHDACFYCCGIVHFVLPSVTFLPVLL